MSAAVRALPRLLFLGGAFLLLWRGLDIATLKEELTRADPRWLAAALVLFNTSQALSAARLQVLLRPLEALPAFGDQLRLYYAGMFCNLYLPGGIGGDGLKVYWLRRRFGVGVGALVRAMILDRAAGLAALIGLTAALAAVWSGDWLWVPAALIGPGLYPPVAGRMFPRFRGTGGRALMLSLGIQGLQGGAAWALMQALGLGGPIYLLLFYLSGIAALAPITLGGLGARELVYFYGLPWAGLPAQGGVALALLFFAVTGISSLAGWLQTGRFLRREGGAGNR